MSDFAPLTAAPPWATYELEVAGFWRSLWLVLRGWRIEVFRKVDPCRG